MLEFNQDANVGLSIVDIVPCKKCCFTLGPVRLSTSGSGLEHPSKAHNKMSQTIFKNINFSGNLDQIANANA